jgi:hypothetical protein
VLGFLQGILPILGVLGMDLKSKHDYKMEVASIPEDKKVYMSIHDDLGEGFDYNGRHFVGLRYMMYNDITPLRENDAFKTEDYGAIIYDNGSHHLMSRVVNDKDYDIFETGTIYDPFVPKDEYDEISDYYLNEAPLICQVQMDNANIVKDVDSIDSAKAREIRDFIETEGNQNTDYEFSKDAYLYFYSKDAMYYFCIHCMETSEGLAVDMNGKATIISGSDAEYLKGLYEE